MAILSIRKAEPHAKTFFQYKRRFDANGDLVVTGVSIQDHFNGEAIYSVRAGDLARPEIQALVNVVQVGQGCFGAVFFQQHKPYETEMKTMRILPEPV